MNNNQLNIAMMSNIARGSVGYTRYLFMRIV